MSGESNQVKWRGVQPVSGIRGVWPAIDAVRIAEGTYQSGQGTVVVYTVPAGKILYISSAYLTSRLTAAVATYTWMITRNVADVTQVHMLSAYYSVVDAKTFAIPYVPALELPAGYDVAIYVHSATLSSRGGIFGWLEDA